MEKRIQTAITEIENEEDIVVLYACESGSRAWGFASTDSDYDVRFLYIHRPSWYLAVDLESKRDVIERPITDVLDISGWDLRKALKLFRKSNPPLLEWLGSPIVYREEHRTAARLREHAKKYYSPTACGYHYLHMAQGNYRDYLRGDMVWRKKYFYVLRPLLAIRWLESETGVVPMEFDVLVKRILPEGALREAIDALVVEKATGAELDRGPRIPVISEFISCEMDRLEGSGFERAPARPSIEPLNELFRRELDEVFGRD